MKLLMTADTVGGVWSYALELARALGPFELDIVLATMGTPLAADQWAEVAHIPHVQVRESAYKLEWMQDPWDDVKAAGRWLLELADETQPDVIHLNGYAHGALPWNAPVLMVGHSCVLSWYRAVRRKPAGAEWDRYRAEVRRGLQAADLVVAPTRAMLDSLDADYGPLPWQRVILNGRDPSDFVPERKEPFLFAAGRLWDEAKNIGLLARVAPQLTWPVHVAGEAQHPEGGRATLPHVELMGRLSCEAMVAQFSRAAVYVLPARYEPFGLTPLEAALCGCALVLGDIPTLREIWGEAATFVPPDDERALVETINTLVADPAEVRRRADKAISRALRLHSARMAAEYVAAYRHLIHAPQLQPAGSLGNIRTADPPGDPGREFIAGRNSPFGHRPRPPLNRNGNGQEHH